MKSFSNRKQMENFILQILTAILCMTATVFCSNSNCNDDPVLLNEDFMVCCKGLPRYTSEYCVDDLLEKSSFSQECLVDCMYKEFQIYDGETFDNDAVKTLLDTKILNEDFNLVYSKAFESCMKLNKYAMEYIFPSANLTNTHGCDLYPSYMDICIWYYTLTYCPETYATDDEQCNGKRQWLKDCLLDE